ncbi:sodium:solute symporter family transporter [uncultured Gulosibacter sp.]|uniref:sodium:solute symporter family protein n=1 Tax=uncultured Gulosibacter sp. TaxID=1339167 RepID=UPI00288AB3FF|nr:sodium:solute symporter family protein [uncultured Gulosibacter sp.]
MNTSMVVGYGSVVVLLIAIGVVLERRSKSSSSMSDYATGGRSFGPWYSAMAFVNTWLPGTILISFAGLTAAAGVIGFYMVLYSLFGAVLMYLLARPVSIWGHSFDLRTQADLMGLRYNSTTVRVTAAVIGFLASLPWVVLGMQSLALVFEYLSFGAVAPIAALIIGTVVIAVRQIWTVRYGARGVVIGDMVQGIVAYLFGGLLLLGLTVWMLATGFNLSGIPSTFFVVPGLGSDLGPLYFFSLILAGALGGWCWPDIFVRLFTSKSERTIQRAALRAAPILLVFSLTLMVFALLASQFPGVAEKPDHVFFIVASAGGVLTLTLAGLAVISATFGNVGANLQALGTIAANDIAPRTVEAGRRSPRLAQTIVAALTILCALATVLTVNITGGLISLAMMSYEGIVQLAPALFLGIFWRRGTALAATAGMIGGLLAAVGFYLIDSTSITWLGGVVPGVAGLMVNTLIYVVLTVLKPNSRTEQHRVDQLFESVRLRTEAIELPKETEGATS